MWCFPSFDTALEHLHFEGSMRTTKAQRDAFLYCHVPILDLFHLICHDGFLLLMHEHWDLPINSNKSLSQPLWFGTRARWWYQAHGDGSDLIGHKRASTCVLSLKLEESIPIQLFNITDFRNGAIGFPPSQHWKVWLQAQFIFPRASPAITLGALIVRVDV